MKNIVVGCPYSALANLRNILTDASAEEGGIISVDDISYVDSQLVVLQNEERIPFVDMCASYIRYPYDLISPHAETYQRRERTEFLKTLALMLDHVSLNKITSAHFARNRHYSLKRARDMGINVPDSWIVRDGHSNLPDEAFITKSLGNCFFSDKDIDTQDTFLTRILSYEKDGDDHAYIYRPHMLRGQADVERHVKELGICYVQAFKRGIECRIFLVGSDVYMYQREKIASIDKSSAGLVPIDSEIIKSELPKLKQLQMSLRLQYVCMDAIICNKGLCVIDINPYGSFPAYDRNPEVTHAVANLLLSYA